MKDLVVVFLLIYKGLLILSIMKFYCQNWNTMVCVVVPLSDLDLIYLIESSMFLSLEVILTCFQLPVVYHKVLH